MTGAHRPRKRFGQHFLVDAATIDHIIGAIAPAADEHIVEIGPGQGALTGALARRAGRLTLVELDRDLVARLEREYADADQVQIIGQDALEVDYASLGAPLRLVGNLPYNISTPLLFHLARFVDAIEDMHFMLQKEVVDRITATPGGKAWGRLGVMLALAFDSEFLFEVGPESFDPPPRVDSAVLRLSPREAPPDITDARLLEDVVRRAFSKRRKTLRNALREVADTAHFEAAEIDPTQRAETVSADRFAALANAIAAR
ncbi:MAG: 16S rRNA (adenine(1518)-N(6)/adenine(1519)-N(6))-dimethyltransferase RsmA [Pseudomonadota bacterium]